MQKQSRAPRPRANRPLIAKADSATFLICNAERLVSVVPSLDGHIKIIIRGWHEGLLQYLDKTWPTPHIERRQRLAERLLCFSCFRNISLITGNLATQVRCRPVASRLARARRLCKRDERWVQREALVERCKSRMRSFRSCVACCFRTCAFFCGTPTMVVLSTEPGHESTSSSRELCSDYPTALPSSR